MPTTQEILKSTIETSSIAHGLLNPEQARRFIQQTFDATKLAPIVRHEMRTARSGEIDKIGINARILRAKTENVDDGYRADVNTSQITYQTTPVRLPWEITEETLRENIEGQNFETIVTNLMTNQLGRDLEDLYLNSDSETSDSDPDYDFLKVNDGWIKQITNGGHVVDATSLQFDLDLFYNTLATLPNKYNDGALRWLMSPRRSQQWENYLLDKIVNAGGAVPDSVYTAPARVQVVECPCMSDDKIILTNPKNLIVVNTYGVQIRKTTEGKEAVMQDKRFYVVHLDFDPIIEELDATAIITNLS